MSEFDKELKPYILDMMKMVWRDAQDGRADKETVCHSAAEMIMSHSKQGYEKHVIGKDEPTFGAQNEAGDISEDDYIMYGRNSIRAEQRKTLRGELSHV